MKHLIKKMLEVFTSKEALEALGEDEITKFLQEVKHKKMEFINFKKVDIQETKNADGTLRIVAIASTDAIDRGGDVVIPQGIKLTNIKESIPMFLQHEPELVLGGWDKWYINEKNQFIVEGNFLPPVMDWQKAAYNQVKARVLNGISIGYYPEVFEFDDVNETRILKQIELVEVSIVSIPMNQECAILSVDEKNVRDLPKKSDTAEDLAHQGGNSPESITDKDPAIVEEPNEMAKIKEENEALKTRVSALEADISDYETLLEETNKLTEELMTAKGVKYEA